MDEPEIVFEDFRAKDRAALAVKLRALMKEIHYAPWLRNAEVVLLVLADCIAMPREVGADYELAVMVREFSKRETPQPQEGQ